MSSASTSPTTAPARQGPGATAPRVLVGVAAAVVGVISAATLASQGTSAEGLQLLNRFLARSGFLIFIGIYAASPLMVLAPGRVPRALIRSRRGLGLAYALVMATHLVVILAWYATPEIALELDTSVVGGGLGFVLIGALAATSNDAARRRLGSRSWKALHGSTLHFLWVIYAVTYLGRISEWGSEYWPGLLTVAALPGLRLVAWRRRRLE